MTQPVADAHDRTVRWRQLVDLLSRPHDEIDPALLDAALTMIKTGMRSVARPVRAATARSIAGRAAEPRLIAIFASDKLEVAAPLLAAAPFDEAGWATVMAAASKEVAAFMRTLRGEAVPVQAEQPAEVPAEAPEEPAPSIGDMVARIERLKSKREVPSAEPAVPQHPELLARPGLFRWECDASGQIGWVDGAPRGALIGRSLPGEEGAPRELIRAFTDRMPFDDTPLSLPVEALEGEWRLSGIPAFSPVDGRFLGYRGVARREGEPEAMPSGPPPALADAEALRETIHEIKTPLNAIIGFAEIIDGQYLGPAHRSYRQRASEIVSQARTLLSAIEDLDLAARMQRGRASEAAQCDLADLLPPLVEELGNRGLSRDVRLRVATPTGQVRAALDADLVTRLLRRLLGATIDAAAAGELIELEVRAIKGRLSLSFTRPMATRQLSEQEMLDPSFMAGPEGEGSKLGLGFALRLVRGLARLAGGDLGFTPAEVVLTLPAAKG